MNGMLFCRKRSRKAKGEKQEIREKQLTILLSRRSTVSESIAKAKEAAAVSICFMLQNPEGLVWKAISGRGSLGEIETTDVVNSTSREQFESAKKEKGVDGPRWSFSTA
jgi:hypothetical protein